MPLPFKPGDQVRYIGPLLLGQPFQGVVIRLPKPHKKKGEQRHASDDRVMVQVTGEVQRATGRPRPRPVRPEHLVKI
jgi:hypothetical protein